MDRDLDTIFAACPKCKHSVRVIVGRKSTTRQATCKSCGTRYDYSAWKLSQPRADEDSISLRTFYQVDLFPAALGER